MNIALYGGSFDPPHAGHVAVVKEALRVLPVDQVIVIPASKNPFKPSVRANGTDRYGWLKKIFAAYPKVAVSDFEILQNRSVYTIETVRHYAAECDKIYLIIGADNLEQLSRWHQYGELNERVEWVVATRGDIPIPETMIRLEVKEPISSTDFRNRFTSLGLDPAIENEIITYYKEINESKN